MAAKGPEKLTEANKLIFVKRYEAARMLLDELLESPQHRANLLIHLRRIELAMKLRDLETVRQRYLDLLRTDPHNVVWRIALTLAEQHAEVLDPRRAAAVFQEIMREHGNDPGAFYGIAFSMEVLKNFERAIFNYQECLKLDPNWYPAAFGLSQIYYQSGEDKQGDHYFYQFEDAAPYNVYGNFDTHRRLTLELLDKGRWDDAEKAMTTLSEWWQENKANVPAEIQVYELLMLARIFDEKGDREKAEFRRMQAASVANQLLGDAKVGENVLYFVAKSFEEFNQSEPAFRFYKRILASEDGSRPEVVQKIGGQFLVMGEYKLAKELFDEAYQHHPDNPDVRFCQLVANLKIKGVDVEEYLIGKERMKQLVQNPADRVELLSLLHSLIAKFKDDPDVLNHLAEIHLRLGNVEKAGAYYRQMYALDPRSKTSALKFASYEMQHGNEELANETLEGVLARHKLEGQEMIELHWLKTNYFFRRQDYRKAVQHLNKILAVEPWNVSYLCLQALILMETAPIDREITGNDQVLEQLHRGEENNLDWRSFDARTREIEGAHGYELAYVREKIRFLYTENRDDYLKRLLSVAARFDAARCTYDFLRLLNTNFDSPSINWALGKLFKELWQLETACVWFEQILLHPDASEVQKARAYLELADSYVWRNVQLPKAIEYVKLSMDLGERNNGKTHIIMAHAYLRLGQVRQAQIYLHDEESKDPEAIYLKGLVQYRNGAERQANLIWKPLLTMRSENLRFHNIKQEILKYYFDKEPYLRAN